MNDLLQWNGRLGPGMLQQVGIVLEIDGHQLYTQILRYKGVYANHWKPTRFQSLDHRKNGSCQGKPSCVCRDMHPRGFARPNFRAHRRVIICGPVDSGQQSQRK